MSSQSVNNGGFYLSVSCLYFIKLYIDWLLNIGILFHSPTHTSCLNGVAHTSLRRWAVFAEGLRAVSAYSAGRCDNELCHSLTLKYNLKLILDVFIVFLSLTFLIVGVMPLPYGHKSAPQRNAPPPSHTLKSHMYIVEYANEKWLGTCGYNIHWIMWTWEYLHS